MRVLTCSPLYFKVWDEDPAVNPWMRKEFQPDRKKALEQWHGLIGIFWDLGLDVLTIEPQEELGDMCFTANAAWGRDNIFVLANFHPKVWWRKAEVANYARWFVNRRFSVYFLPENVYFEGQGDIVTLERSYIYGYGIRNSIEVVDHLEETFRLKRIIPAQLVDPRFYHTDVALHYARGAKSVLWCPDAFDKDGIRRIEREIKKEGLDQLQLSSDEVVQELGKGRRNFLLNAVYVGNTEIFPWDVSYSEFPEKVKRFIKEREGQVIPRDLSEFGTSGGGARCLSLFLD